MRKNNLGVFTLSVCFLMLFIVGCGGYGSPMNNPLPSPGTSNMPDHFQFQITSGAYSTITETLDYVWSNSGTSAKVTVTSSITAGAANLQISDSMGKLVIDQPFTSNGSFITAMGVTGDWKIHLVLTGIKGTVKFNVDKM